MLFLVDVALPWRTLCGPRGSLTLQFKDREQSGRIWDENRREVGIGVAADAGSLHGNAVDVALR